MRDDEVQCPNYIVCGQKRHPDILACFEGFCGDCAITYGDILVTKAGEDICRICLEHKSLFVKYWNCDHYCCKTCFVRMTTGCDANTTEPQWNDFDNEHSFEEAMKQYEESISEPLDGCPICGSSTEASTRYWT